ncbi:putative disease resistance protein RGA4 [Abrus precatorius]|uniref:Disease resistance protein RGA4 n=1 Tax=Abrus precatorius TaxID=3816 RepID=A0A8B8K087_ABRPR|nr:putative disease resistance protein RGA4 [Abrus precatorius]
MEDVGDQFVKILLMNSFFQDAEIDEYGEIKRFKMHDLMHDLAAMVAGNDYFYLDSEATEVKGRPMHVSLESNAIHLLESLDPSRLRTLILPYNFVKEKYLSVAKFKYLRVLKMGGFCFFNFSENLKHLRYLEAFEQPPSLPKYMSNLVFLQTLKLKNCDEESFSEVVTKLVNLRWLEVFDYESLSGMAVGWGKLLSLLQFLPIFVVRDSQKTRCGTLNELKDLNLRGNLEIKHLDRVRDVALESRDVNLKEKKFLQSLTLHWSRDHFPSREANRNHERFQLLENLQPHRNLKRLTGEWYPGQHFPNWLSLLTNVVHITLLEFQNCPCLPPLERLPSLKSLEIESLEELEYIDLDEDDSAVTFFPSLESLKLEFCSNLRGWRRRGDDINENSHNLSLPLSFPRLSQLHVSFCPKLTSMPTFPKVKDLEWRRSSAELLIATLNSTVLTCSADSSSSAAPLSMLKQLTISGPTDFPKGWIQNLTSLESLEIIWSENETLEEFETWFKDDTNCLPSLRQIRIYFCQNLKASPDWICNLDSKSDLIQNLTSLVASAYQNSKSNIAERSLSRLTNCIAARRNESSYQLKDL